VVVADIVLGAVSGIEVLHAARRLETRPAVILLTGYGALGTAIEAVRAGAHDYLLKPCDEDALLASVRAATVQARSERRLREAARVLTGLAPGAPDAPPAAPLAAPNMPSAMAPRPSKDGQTDGPVSAANERAAIAIGALIVGPSRHEVRFRDVPVALTLREYALLRHLAEHPGQVRPYDEIAWAMHGLRLPASEARISLHTHVGNLRRKLDPAYLVTDPGTGYMLTDPHGPP